MTLSKRDKNLLERFALKHKLILEDRGEVGFGRPCVGFTKLGSYVDWIRRDDNFKEVGGWCSKDVWPPDDANAYHKHPCMAVLVDGDSDESYEIALKQLAKWVRKLNKAKAYVDSYDNNPQSFVEALFKGNKTFCLRAD